MQSIKLKNLEYNQNNLTKADLAYLDNNSIIEHKYKFELQKNGNLFEVNAIIKEYKNHVQNYTVTIIGLDDEIALTHDHTNHKSFHTLELALSAIIGRLRIAQDYYNE